MANQSQTNERVRRYEVGYLVAPTVPEQEVEEMADAVSDTVADHGEILAAEVPEMQELAYTMEATTSAGEREFDRGQFGWVQFAVAPDALDDIEDAFAEEADIMRHLLVTIDEEDVGGRDEEGEGENEKEQEEAEQESEGASSQQNADESDDEDTEESEDGGE